MGMGRWRNAVALVPALLFVAAMVALFQRWEVVFWLCAGATVLSQYTTIHRD